MAQDIIRKTVSSVFPNCGRIIGRYSIKDMVFYLACEIFLLSMCLFFFCFRLRLFGIPRYFYRLQNNIVVRQISARYRLNNDALNWYRRKYGSDHLRFAEWIYLFCLVLCPFRISSRI